MGPLLITIFVATGWVATAAKISANDITIAKNSHKQVTLEIAECVAKYHPGEAELYKRWADDSALWIEYETQTEVCLVNGQNKINCVHLPKYDDRVESCF